MLDSTLCSGRLCWIVPCNTHLNWMTICYFKRACYVTGGLSYVNAFPRRETSKDYPIELFMIWSKLRSTITESLAMPSKPLSVTTPAERVLKLGSSYRLTCWCSTGDLSKLEPTFTTSEVTRFKASRHTSSLPLFLVADGTYIRSINNGLDFCALQREAV